MNEWVDASREKVKRADITDQRFGSEKKNNDKNQTLAALRSSQGLFANLPSRIVWEID